MKINTEKFEKPVCNIVRSISSRLIYIWPCTVCAVCELQGVQEATSCSLNNNRQPLCDLTHTLQPSYAALMYTMLVPLHTCWQPVLF